MGSTVPKPQFLGLARRCVLGTQHIVFLGLAYRLLYGGAKRVVKLLCLFNPDLKGLLLRVAVRQQKTVPGLSDFDFTLLIEPRDINERLRILERFRRQERYLTIVAPMIGEWLIMTSDELVDHLRICGHGPFQSIKRLEPVFLRGKFSRAEMLQMEQQARKESGTRNFLRDAFFRLDYFALPRLVEFLADPSKGHARYVEHAFDGVKKRLQQCGDAPDEWVFSANDSQIESQRLIADYIYLLKWCQKCVQSLAPSVGESVAMETELPNAVQSSVHDIAKQVEESLLEQFDQRVSKEEIGIFVWPVAVSPTTCGAAMIVDDQSVNVRTLTPIIQSLVEAVRKRTWSKSSFCNEILLWSWRGNPPLLHSRSTWAFYCAFYPFETAAFGSAIRVFGKLSVVVKLAGISAWREEAGIQWASTLHERNICLLRYGHTEQTLDYLAQAAVRLKQYADVIKNKKLNLTQASMARQASIASAYQKTTNELNTLRDLLL